MGRRSMDPTLAAAESRLDRLDDEGGDAQGDSGVSIVEFEESMHIEGETPSTADDEVIEAIDQDAELGDLVGAFNEAFNARDLDGLLELVADDLETPGWGHDRSSFADAVEELWERRPSVCLTGVQRAGSSLSIVWEFGDDAGWWPVAVVHFDDVEDGSVGVVAVSDDPALLEEIPADPPDLDLEQGARWDEWEEGAAD